MNLGGNKRTRIPSGNLTNYNSVQLLRCCDDQVYSINVRHADASPCEKNLHCISGGKSATQSD
jgi:hypothetical protein